jgi:hypothetical protein
MRKILFIILFVTVLILFFRRIDSFTNIRKEIKKGTIFVSIASYRDAECSMTVRTIYNKARYPERIFLGICEQNKDQELEKCVSSDPEVNKYLKNIRFSNMPYTEAKGPSYARYHCSKLWDGEEYFLQIDSHTFFESDWDINLIEMLEQCRQTDLPENSHQWGTSGSKRPVLSVYPPSSEQMNTPGFPEMDNGKITDTNIPIFLAGFRDYTSTKPTRSPKPFYAAGFMFLDSTFLYDIPYDPTLNHLFQGEEVLFSARLFTHGYDAFTPNKKVGYHHYSRQGPLYWNDNKTTHDENRIKSEQKVLKLLGLHSDADANASVEYGLGTFRSIDDFWKASGIKVENGKIKEISRWTSDTRNENTGGWCFCQDHYTNIKKYDL